MISIAHEKKANSKDDKKSNKVTSDLLALFQSGQISDTNIASPIDESILSKTELKILRSNEPIDINETEVVTVLGQTGVLINKEEIDEWKGDLNIADYVINEDRNPQIITKKLTKQTEYIQELCIQYLRPPTPPAPGELIINQENDIPTPPAPPLILRQQPLRAATPEPLILREAPPKPPTPVGRVKITISGKRLPPPPRKVVIERLMPLPEKPQNVIIERWLPYKPVKRRVIFNKSSAPEPVMYKPNNVIVQWEAPEVIIKQETKYLGIVRANPNEYVSKYGKDLTSTNKLPDFVKNIETPKNIKLAADVKPNQVHELVGDLEGLKYINLEKEGLTNYREQLERLNIIKSLVTQQKVETKRSNSKIISAIFDQIDKDFNGVLSIEEAESIFLRINSRLKRSYGEDDVKDFFNVLDSNNDGVIDVQEFKKNFNKLNNHEIIF